MTRRSTASLALVTILLACSACQSSAIATAPSTSPGPTSTTAAAAPTIVTASPALSTPGTSASIAQASPSQSVLPTVSQTPDGAIDPIPAGWAILEWRDGGVGIAIPPDWTPDDLDATAADLGKAIKSAAPSDARIMRWWLRLHAAGAVRLKAAGSLSGGHFPEAALSVTIETGDTSQADLVSRLIDTYETELGATDVATQQVSTPIGPATELRTTYSYLGASSSRTDIAIFLPSRRSMTMTLGTYFLDDDVEDVATTFAATIHIARAPVFAFPQGPSPRDTGPFIREAVDRLSRLSSYRFAVVFRSESGSGGSTDPEVSDSSYRGKLERSGPLGIDGVLSLAVTWAGSDTGLGGLGRLAFSDDWIWVGDRNGVLEKVPFDGTVAESVSSYLPEVSLAKYLTPQAADYAWVGEEEHNGVLTAHYRATSAGGARYLTLFQMAGTVIADLWVAKEGGYFVGVSIHAVDTTSAPSSRPVIRDFLLEIDITNPNDPINVVHLPD